MVYIGLEIDVENCVFCINIDIKNREYFGMLIKLKRLFRQWLLLW